MTSQKEQLQTLIAEIDGVLGKASPRLPWVMSGDATQQRQLLERIRNYLVSIQPQIAGYETLAQGKVAPNLVAYDIHYQPASTPELPVLAETHVQQAAAQQIVQAVLQEMGLLRSHLTQALQADVESLQQQRSTLLQEIHQLESQRQLHRGGALPQDSQQAIAEFLQVLMDRFQDSLSQQLVQTVSAIASQNLRYANQPLSGEPGNLPRLDSTQNPSALLYGSDQIEQLQRAQAQTEQLVMRLDSTLSVVFDSLQRNVQSYQESLSQGLEKMHGLGQQGEMMFTAWINLLAQQLGRESSSYLQSSLPSGLQGLNLDTPSGADALKLNLLNLENQGNFSSPQDSFALNTVISETPFADLELPYPGAELPQTSEFSLLDKIGKAGSEDLPLEDLDLSDLNLGDLSFAAPLTETTLESDYGESAALDLGDAAFTEAPRLQSADEESDALELADPLTELELEATVADLLATEPVESDAALEFLNQLNDVLEEAAPAHPQPTPDPEPTRSSLTPDLVQDLTELRFSTESLGDTADADALTDAGADAAEAAPDADRQDELDALYQSLFGAEAVASEEPAALQNPDELGWTTNGHSASEERTTVESLDLGLDLGLDLNLDLGTEPSLIPPALDAIAPSLATPSSEASQLESSAATVDAGGETLAAMDEDLFGGLGDPSVAEPPAPTPRPEADLLEDFLFAEPESIEPEPENLTSAAASSAPTAMDLFADLLTDPQASPVTPSLTPPPATPIPSSEENLDPVSVSADAEADLALNWFEDSFVVASPDETLLVTDEAEAAEADLDLWLDANTLQQLSQDLSSLESIVGFVPQEAVPQVTPARPSHGSEEPLTLDAFGSSLAESLTPQEPSLSPVPPPPVQASVPLDLGFGSEAPNPNDLTLAGFDSFFGDLPPAGATTPKTESMFGGFSAPEPAPPSPTTEADLFSFPDETLPDKTLLDGAVAPAAPSAPAVTLEDIFAELELPPSNSEKKTL